MAMGAANALYDVDPAYLRRRLGVIAVEDVLVGAPLAVACTLAAIGDPSWRNWVGERRALVRLVGVLAAAPKDRSAVELMVAVEHDQTLKVPSTGWRAGAHGH